MEKILYIAIAALGLAACGKSGSNGGGGDEPEKEATYVLSDLKGTRVRTSVADPCLIYERGMFYLTMTGTSNIAVISDNRLSRLTATEHPLTSNLVYKSAEDPSVEAFFGEGAKLSGTWSPELHYFSEEEHPGNSGWYMLLALRKENSGSEGSSAYIRPVVLKSLSGRPSGPYGNPVTNEIYRSQALLDMNGDVVNEWNVGHSVLRIPSGEYKGLYFTWVDEVGRGQGLGNFYQRIRIAKMAKPWQLGSEGHTVTTPTQGWEKKGASATLPQVVEGATAVYGDNGEIFIAYCGSGYWSDYGLGQLTLKRENGDYADPLQEASWIKYEHNPVFTSNGNDGLHGAGHATFLRDGKGNRFMCYHAYPVVNGVKGDNRNAYIEPYTIDYEDISETAPQGVIRFGLLGTGVAAPTNSNIEFYINAKYQ